MVEYIIILMTRKSCPACKKVKKFLSKIKERKADSLVNLGLDLKNTIYIDIDKERHLIPEYLGHLLEDLPFLIIMPKKMWYKSIDHNKKFVPPTSKISIYNGKIQNYQYKYDRKYDFNRRGLYEWIKYSIKH